jgi:hypothetical protein
MLAARPFGLVSALAERGELGEQLLGRLAAVQQHDHAALGRLDRLHRRGQVPRVRGRAAFQQVEDGHRLVHAHQGFLVAVRSPCTSARWAAAARLVAEGDQAEVAVRGRQRRSATRSTSDSFWLR